MFIAQMIPTLRRWIQAPLFEPITAGFDYALYTTQPNYVLKGNWGPIKDEVTSQVYHGAPTDVNGMYLRNGANHDKIPSDNRVHFFDGDGMIHAVRIKDGTV